MTARTMSLQEKLDCLKKEIPKIQRGITHGSKKPHKLVNWNRPAPPFFYLPTSSFWEHKIIVSRGSAYSKRSTSGSGSERIQENVVYAYLSREK